MVDTVMRTSQLAQMSAWIANHTPNNGIHSTYLESVQLLRDSEPRERFSWMYEPMLVIAVQGKKYLYLDGDRYTYDPGNFLALFMPMVVECELVEASEAEPLLGMGIRLDRHRLATLILKMDSVAHTPDPPDLSEPSGIFSAPLNHQLLDATLRLLHTLDDPIEAAVLGESIVDEIYYRLLTNERGGALRILLRQQGQMQQISKAVDYLHDKLHENVSVEEMAAVVNMSTSGFHKKFKEVMHLSPIQYTKRVRLNRARTYLMAGKNVSEAGYMVGYNSPAQFSREYKRQFGVVPSAAIS